MTSTTLRAWECALLLGGFDGMHVGHRTLLAAAKGTGLPVGVMAISGGKGEDLFTFEEREEIFSSLGAASLLGVPFVCFMLTLMPFIRETTAALESGTDGQIMAMGFEWMQWLARVARFVTEQWQWVQLGGAAVSLPLSYLCMRTTPQP